MMNIINGGAHAANNLDIQEFMIIPVGAKSVSVRLSVWGLKPFISLKKFLKDKGLSTAVGDEGGFAPDLESNEAAIHFILNAVDTAGYKPGLDIGIALDAAASEFYKNRKYRLESENRSLTAEQMIDYYDALIDKYPILSIEDGLAEQDWNGWETMTDRLEGMPFKLWVMTFSLPIRKSLKKGSNGALPIQFLIKLNQIGTVTETLDAIEMAKQAGYTTVVSHRSGETEDTFIADLAVGANAGQIKTGSLSRSDRVAKYNQLIRIEEELGQAACFADSLL